MEYITKIKVADSYEINSNPSEDKPYISYAALNEVTANGNGIQIGGTASNKLTFRLYNSPLTALDGLKVQLFAKENIDAEEGILSLSEIPDDDVFLETITDDGIYEADQEPTSEKEASTDETNALMESYGYDLDTVSQVDEDPDADNYVIEETTATAETEAASNGNDRAETGEAETVDDVANEESDGYQSMGIFYVTSVSNNTEYMTITAMDGFCKMGSEFAAEGTTIAEVWAEFVEQCNDLGIEADEDATDSTEELAISSTYTLRDAAGMLAGLLGCYANFNREGILELRPYMINSDYNIPVTSISSVSDGIDSVYIDSVKCGLLIKPDGEEISDSTLTFTNPYMTDALLTDIYDIYAGIDYRVCSVNCDWYFNIQCGDIVEVETSDEVFNLCVTNQTIDFDGGTTLISSIGDSSTVTAQKVLSNTDTVSNSSKTATNYIDDTGEGIILKSEDSTLSLSANGMLMTDANGNELFDVHEVVEGSSISVARKSDSDGTITIPSYLTWASVVITTKNGYYADLSDSTHYWHKSDGTLTTKEYTVNSSKRTFNFGLEFKNYPVSITGTASRNEIDVEVKGESILTKDTGWVTLDLNNQFESYPNVAVPKVRRVGNVVQVHGILTPNAKLTGGTTQYSIAVLPDGFYPVQEEVIVCHGSSRNIWTLTIDADGGLSFSRYGTTAAYVDLTATSGAWLPFSATYITDDDFPE